MNWNNNKYHNKKTIVDGITFDSKKEANRYTELRLLERAGEISNIEMQVKYILIPSQREPDTTGNRGRTIKGKVLERECSYVADFRYKDNRNNETVVEDVKGMRTEVYKIKRKLMLYIHGIRIVEI